MRLFFTPKTLALASGLALAVAVWPGQAWGQAAGKPSTAITVDRVSFEQLQDNYSAGNSWMLAKVEFTAHSNPDAQAVNPRWVKDVSVTLTLGWGASGTPPQLDLAVSATAKLVAVEVNTSTVVMFFVPPEFLQSGSKNPAGLSASSQPTYYVAQIAAAGATIDPGKMAVSSNSLPTQNYIDGFLRASGEQTSKNAGMMLTADSVPAYISLSAAQKANGETIPTLKSSAPAM